MGFIFNWKLVLFSTENWFYFQLKTGFIFNWKWVLFSTENWVLFSTENRFYFQLKTQKECLKKESKSHPMPWKGIKKLFNALKRNQKAIQCLGKESKSYSMPWKGIKKPSNALERNQKAIQCLGKESESHPMSSKDFWGSERPIGLIERLVYRAPKKGGRTINKCASIITVVSVLSLTKLLPCCDFLNCARRGWLRCWQETLSK